MRILLFFMFHFVLSLDAQTYLGFNENITFSSPDTVRGMFSMEFYSTENTTRTTMEYEDTGIRYDVPAIYLSNGRNRKFSFDKVFLFISNLHVYDTLQNGELLIDMNYPVKIDSLLLLPNFHFYEDLKSKISFKDYYFCQIKNPCKYQDRIFGFKSFSGRLVVVKTNYPWYYRYDLYKGKVDCEPKGEFIKTEVYFILDYLPN